MVVVVVVVVVRDTKLGGNICKMYYPQRSGTQI